MLFVNATWLFVLGMLGAANLIIARKPEAKEIIAKFAPYQGWMGVASVLYGAYEIIWCLRIISWMGDGLMPMLTWIALIAGAGLQIALGLLLGVGTAKTFIKSEQATEKLAQVAGKLAPFQGTLGLIAMAVGVATLVLSFLW